ncbi:helix-turn-helix domain-containing protein [Naasia sp. SYSU D00948]|uniref:winged helix-turn-helix transcriptional regulator n=1 Tax=Naasia sp. SYSU D00948 TaxID=2817379 RepID=UPI001B30D650|nr:helix-turn-helix domain-containing protein [Naasia sp. SYSU D00948]
MTDRKSYAQYCGVARSLDLVGDRWTLLLVRELLLAPQRFSELQRTLPGMASNLLAERLRRMREDRLVVQDAGGVYRLTERGRGLEAVLLELIRWGTPYMLTGPAGDRSEDRWILLALKALLQDDEPRREEGILLIRSGSSSVVVEMGASGRRVRVEQEGGEEAGSRATVTTPALPLLFRAMATGAYAEGALSGDPAFAREALRSAVLQRSVTEARAPLARMDS